MNNFEIIDCKELAAIVSIIEDSCTKADDRFWKLAHEAVLSVLSDGPDLESAFVRLIQIGYIRGDATSTAYAEELSVHSNIRPLRKTRPAFKQLIYLIAGILTTRRAVVFSTRNELIFPQPCAGFENIHIFNTLPDAFRFSHELIWCKKGGAYEADSAKRFFDFAERHLILYKNQRHILRSFVRLCFYSGVSNLSEVDGNLIHWFRANDETLSVRSFGIIEDFLIEVGAKNIHEKPSNNFSPDFPWLKHTLGPKESSKKHRTKTIEIDGKQWVWSPNNTGLRYAGIEGAKVYFPARHEKNYGGWVFSGTLSDYRPDNLIESDQSNLWLLSQIDFLNSQNEKSTKRSKTTFISLFNAYLFGYLPDAIANCNIDHLKAPKTPKDFKSGIFVSRSRVVMDQLCVTSDSKMPLTLIDFIDIHYGSKQENVNRPRDCLMVVKQYFDFVSAKLSEIDGCQITANPITHSDQRSFKGHGYRKSRKKLVDFEYWLLLREFLVVVAEAMLDKFDNPATTKAKATYISVDKNIAFADYLMHIDDIDATKLGTAQVVREIGGGKSLYVLNPRNVIIWLIMSFTGLRYSNVLWLDSTTFDGGDSQFDGFQTIHVNTDKAKLGPFDSLIPSRVMEILKRYQRLKTSMFKLDFSPVKYQGNDGSKWHIINPIFDSTKTLWKSGPSIEPLIVAFESFMNATHSELGSELLYCPEGILASKFQHHLAIGESLDETERYIENKNGFMAKFTPISLKTLLTPHSLRVTLDSYMCLLLPPKIVGKLFTGQTEDMVRYYFKVTPTLENKLKTYKERGLLNFTPEALLRVKEVEKEDDITIRTLKEKGLAAINGIVVSRGKDSHEEIDRLIGLANTSDIAVNRTHICIHGNECPKEILEQIKEKNCGLCPHAISCISDAPAIAATIRDKADRVQEINALIAQERNISSRERESLKKDRIRSVNEMSGWLIRQKLIDDQIDRGNGFFTSVSGHEKVQQKFRGMKVSDHNETLIARILEVDKVPTLHSKKLLLQADRLARALSTKLKSNEFEMTALREVEVAASLIEKTSTLHGISFNATAIGAPTASLKKTLVDEESNVEDQ